MGTEICNIPDAFIREVKRIHIYDSKAYFFSLYKTTSWPPTVERRCVIKNLQPSSYKRKIQSKTESHNEYLKFDITFPIFDLSHQTRQLLSSLKGKKHLVVLESNEDAILLGNEREPLSIFIHDALKDNGAGKDYFLLNIKGTSILSPKQVIS